MNTITKGSRISETCSSNVRSHANVFLSIAFQNQWFYFRTRFRYMKNTSTFYNCFHNYSLSEAGLVG